MTQNVKKMIHLRKPNNRGVVSIRTIIDWDQSAILWDMVVCSKSDTFKKSTAQELCDSSPLKSGIVKFDKQVSDYLSKRSHSMAHAYLKRLVLIDTLRSNVLVNSSGEQRHLPKWANQLIVQHYANGIDA